MVQVSKVPQEFYVDLLHVRNLLILKIYFFYKKSNNQFNAYFLFPQNNDIYFWAQNNSILNLHTNKATGHDKVQAQDRTTRCT